MRIAAEVGGHAYALDVRDGDEVTEVIDVIAQTLGRIDILVNNAGTGDLRPLHTVDDKLWHRLIDVNLTGTFNATRAVIPYMLETGGGAIVNNASVSGLTPTRNEAAYSAAKAGVISLTKSAALEYGPTVRVNCVAPGHVRTPLTAVWEQMPDAFEPIAAGDPARPDRRGRRGRRGDPVPRLRPVELHHRPDPGGRRRRHRSPRPAPTPPSPSSSTGCNSPANADPGTRTGAGHQPGPRPTRQLTPARG